MGHSAGRSRTLLVAARALRELVAKLQRKKRALQGEREERVEAAAGMPVKDLLTRNVGPEQSDVGHH